MNLIQLEQTKNHYLLSIPQALMMRAKKIKPSEWDPRESVWKYPRNKDTYQLLMNEFENDVERVSITPPRQSQIDQSERIEKQNKKIADLERKVKSLKLNNKSVEEQRDHYISTEAEYLNRIVKLTSEVEYLKDDSSDLEKNIKKITKLCIGENHPLGNILDEIDFDFMLPINLQNKLESILKSKLGINKEKKSIVNLIYQCQDQELLSDDAAYLIHAIRKQRNLFAHNAIDHKTRLMRVIFVIAAFSILSSEL